MITFSRPCAARAYICARACARARACGDAAAAQRTGAGRTGHVERCFILLRTFLPLFLVSGILTQQLYCRALPYCFNAFIPTLHYSLFWHGTFVLNLPSAYNTSLPAHTHYAKTATWRILPAAALRIPRCRALRFLCATRP